MARTLSASAGARANPRAPKHLLALRGDDHLVRRLRRGDDAAFEVIYERHVPGILSFCRHMLGSREEAEDAVQQTFAAAHTDLLRDSREIRLKPWLYAIARNRCISMLRARREQPDDRVDGITAGLDDRVEQRAELRELVADLQDLPEDQRAALVLSELRDLSHADVAEALHCKVANVKGLVFRARSGLIERREARSANCEEIQEELASARGGALRRGRLRHHLRACPACTDYLEQVRHQRQMMAAILPVIPTLGLKKGVLAAVGIGGGAGGGGAAGGGGLLASALSATGTTVAKVAAVGVLVGGAGVAGQAALDHGGGPASPAPLAPDRLDGAAAPESDVGPAEAAERRFARKGRHESSQAAKRRRQRERRRARARRHAPHVRGTPVRRGRSLAEKVRGLQRPTRRVPAGGRTREPAARELTTPRRTRPLREPKIKVLKEEQAPVVELPPDDVAP